jgi:hypothetical protein
LIGAWLDNPQETTQDMAAVCADLCVAVVRGISRSS